MPRAKLKTKKQVQKKIRLTKDGKPYKKPGPKPGSHKGPVKKVIGHSMPAKTKKTLESQFAKVNNGFEAFTQHVAAFTYDANTDAGVNAMKTAKSLAGQIIEFRKGLRVARRDLKPVYAD